MTNSLSARCSTARDKFGAYLRKEQSSRNAARVALSSCYAFSQNCFDEHKEFLRLCKDSKISNSGSNVNHYIPVVRLVFGRDVDGEWQPINPQQTSKYANLLDYADFLQIAPSGFDAWLKKGSHEGYLKAAREDEAYQLARGKEDKLARRIERVSIARKQIEARQKPIFGKQSSFNIDMGADGVPDKGLRHLVVDVQSTGEVKIIGFNSDDVKAVENAISKSYVKPKTVKKEWCYSHPLVDLLTVIKLSKGLADKGSNPFFITFKNFDKKCEFLVSQIGVDAGVVIRKTTSRLPEFPIGIPFVITINDARSIFVAAKKSENFCVIKGTISDAPSTDLSVRDKTSILTLGEKSDVYSKLNNLRVQVPYKRKVPAGISSDKIEASAWNQSHVIQFKFEKANLMYSLYVPDKKASKRIDTKPKNPSWKLKINITSEVRENWLLQERLLAKQAQVLSLKFRANTITFYGSSRILVGDFVRIS